MRSASVDFPWSMWAMMEKLRMCCWSAKALLDYERRRSRPAKRSKICRASGIRMPSTAAA
jgi:hypothetical protein